MDGEGSKEPSAWRPGSTARSPGAAFRISVWERDFARCLKASPMDWVTAFPWPAKIGPAPRRRIGSSTIRAWTRRRSSRATSRLPGRGSPRWEALARLTRHDGVLLPEERPGSHRQDAQELCRPDKERASDGSHGLRPPDARQLGGDAGGAAAGACCREVLDPQEVQKQKGDILVFSPRQLALTKAECPPFQPKYNQAIREMLDYAGWLRK